MFSKYFEYKKMFLWEVLMFYLMYQKRSWHIWNICFKIIPDRCNSFSLKLKSVIGRAFLKFAASVKYFGWSLFLWKFKTWKFEVRKRFVNEILSPIIKWKCKNPKLSSKILYHAHSFKIWQYQRAKRHVVVKFKQLTLQTIMK